MANEFKKQPGSDIPYVKPPADIVQKDDSYYILLDMPGVDMKDIDISVNNDVLTIDAATGYPKMENEKLLDNEFDNVHYTRRFTLSDTVDRESIKANLKNGLLKLNLPKVQKQEPKKIEIKRE